mgnify:CR=1 FL=1
MYEGGLEEMKLDKWDWIWLILDVFTLVFYSYLGIVEPNATLWNKIVWMIIVGLSGINFGFTLGKAGRSK